jgi:N-acetylmuramoyl-L-alanine amidase
MKLALSAGHHPDARGACHGDVCEHELAAAWCQLIATHLHDVVEVFPVPTGKLRDKVAAINAAKCDLAVEIHFNACGDCGAFGAETLHFPGSVKGAKVAALIQEAMVGAGASRDRGVKDGWYQMNPAKGPDYFLEATNCTAIIIEPEFIEQHHHVRVVRGAMCRAIAVAIADYLDGVS